MNQEKKLMTERILIHTLEIIYLLTGEEYIVVKKHGEHVTDSSSPCVTEGLCRTQRPTVEHPTYSLIHERNNAKMLETEKILEHTNRIIHLLTGEVPIKCDDVAVYLSMEEWGYLEEHKELYKDVMENNLISLDKFTNRNTRTGYHTTLCSSDRVTEDNHVIENKGTNHLKQSKPSKREKKSVRYMVTESTSHEEGKLTDAHIYTLGEHTGTDYVSTPNKEGGKRNNNAQKIHENFSTIKYMCSEYGKNVQNKSAYKIHERTHTTERLYSCSECQKCFASNSDLVTHQTIHTGEKLFICSECGKCFTNNSTLAKHQRIHSGEKPFLCSECGKCFSQNPHLVEHEKTHSGEKPFVCSECGKCFSQNANLVTHQRIHTGEKPFVCSECGKCFTSKSTVVKHQRIHSGEKPYVCTECGKCFSQNSILVRHFTVHRGEKPFFCAECGKCFSQNSDLVRHKIIHKGEKYWELSTGGS